MSSNTSLICSHFISKLVFCTINLKSSLFYFSTEVVYRRLEHEENDSSLDRHQCTHCHTQLEGMRNILDHIDVCGVGPATADEIENQ